ncbi:MAG: FHA domain-containing protein [Desulfobacteraceae bacterium]|nr:MAG: FHA domain-containing protein [Desulfobacteraceae bacterium]
MAKLFVIEGPMKGLSFELGDQTVFIGRSSKNDIQIKDNAISRKQFKVFKIGNKLFVEDLKSTNGTSINGELITPGEGYETSEGDIISIGKTALMLAEFHVDKISSEVDDLAIQGAKSDSKEKDQLSEERRSRSPRNLELVSKVSELLRQSLDVNEICEKILEYLMDTLPRVDRAAILLYDDQKGDIKEVISRSRQDPWDDAVRYSRSIVSRVLKEGKAIRMSNTDYEAPDDLSESMSTLHICSAMCVPVISNSEIRGAMYVDSIKVPYGFRKDDLLLLNSLSGPVAVVIENEMLSSRLNEAPS